MKQPQQFITRSVLYLLIISLVMWGFGMAYKAVVLPKKLIYQKEADWQRYKQSLPNLTLDYAFFGDSHVAYAVDPTITTSAYNFGIPSEDYAETYFKIKKLLETDGMTIKNIVLQLDTHTFSNKRREKWGWFSEFEYYSEFVPLKVMSQLRQEPLLLTWINKHIQVIGKAEKAMVLYLNPPQDKIERGWIKGEDDFSASDKQATANSRYRSFYYEKNPNLYEPDSLAYLAKTITLATKHHSKITLVAYPVSKEMHQTLINHNINREAFYDQIFNYLNARDLTYTFLDYYTIYFEMPQYFHDADHLNYEGAHLFSQQLFNDLP